MNLLTRARVASAALRLALVDDTSALLRLFPALRYRVHVSSSRSEDVPTSAIYYAEAMEDYALHVWLQRAVRIWAESIAPLPIGIVTPDGQPVADHPLAWALDNPNPEEDGATLWRWWATDMALGGECGWEIARAKSPIGGKKGGGVAIYHRHPQEFAVRPDQQLAAYNVVATYEMTPAVAQGTQPYELPPAEFLHFKFTNPRSPWRGLPPHQAIMLGIDVDQLVVASTHGFFGNSSRPDFAIIAPNGITKLEKDELLFEFMESHKGQPHKPVVLESEVQDIKVLGFPRKDTEWLPQRQLCREEVSAAYGIPIELLTSTPRAYENLDTAERLLWELTLVPLVGFRDRQVTRFFTRIGLLESGLSVRTDLSEIWPLRRARAVQLNDATTLFGMGVPFNTIDARLKLGIGPIPFGEFPHGVIPPQLLPPQGQQGLRALQSAELSALRRLRASRALGRGKGADDLEVCVSLAEVSVGDADLAAELEAGERAGESLMALQERVTALYVARKGVAQ